MTRALHRVYLMGVAATLVLLTATGARADVYAEFQSAIDNLNGTWTYHYNVNLHADTTLKDPMTGSASFLTLFDMHNYVAGSALISAAYTAGGVTDWHVDEQLLGDIAIFMSPADSATVPNLVVRYDGPGDWVAGPGGTIPAVELSLLAATGPEAVPSHLYNGQSYTTSLGTVHGAQGRYRGPLEVPEPGVLSLLFGSGIGGSLLMLRRRNRK